MNNIKNKKPLILLVAIIALISLIFISGKIQNSFYNKSAKNTEAKENKKSAESKDDKNKALAKTKDNNDTKPDSEDKKTEAEKGKSDVSNKGAVANSNTNSTDGADNSKTQTNEPSKDWITFNDNMEPNFKVINMADGGKILYQTHVEVNCNNKSVADVTKRALDHYKVNCYSCNNSYFSMILGISEKDYGGLSGWNYYVSKDNSNFEKPLRSSGDYPYTSGCYITWKYWKDAINEK